MKREMNFENFYVYEGNKVAYRAAQKVVELPGELFNPLYIYGGTGLGKTHLLWAIHSELNKKTTTRFFSAKEFEKYLEEGKFFDVSMIVDDIHAIPAKYQEVILGIIDSSLASNNQICFSGNAAPRDFKNFDVKLLSRLEGGLVCDILPPKEMALVDMIKKKSDEVGIILPDEIALELAQISTGSIRAIEGMINRLVAYSSLDNLSLDIDSVRMILKEFYPKGIYSPVASLLEELKKNASEVLKDVSEKLDVREEYKEKIYIWEMKGFDTSSLKLLLDADIDVLKEEYDAFIKKVERLIELQKDFGCIDVEKFPDESMKIESMLFSPDRVDEIEALLVKIKKVPPIAEATKVARTAKVIATEKSFETLIVGMCNKNVYDIYKGQVLKNLGEKFNPFIIYGKKGTGKTRFLEAAYIDLLSLNKAVKFFDLAHEEDIPRPEDIEEYDVVLFDNFHNTISFPASVRKKIFDSILHSLKSRKAVIFSSMTLPSDISLSDDENSVFEFAIETEIREPSIDVAEAYIKSKLEADEAEQVISEGLPHFVSFYGIDEYLKSYKIEKPAEVIPLGLPGEEQEQVEEVAVEVAEKEEVGIAAELNEAREKSDEQKREIPEGDLPKGVQEDRFMLQEISGELIEDNY